MGWVALRRVLFACLLLLTAWCAANPSVGRAAAFDLDRPEAAIDLKGALAPYHAAGSADTADSDGSLWYITTVANPSLKPITRVLVASDPDTAMLRLFPPDTRARILQVASSDGGVTVARERALGPHAWRVTLPPQTTAALALRLLNAGNPPAVLAWSEPALVNYHRLLAIFIAAVAGLIAAAAAIIAGLAVMTGHTAARWAAATLTGVFLLWMAATGLLERAFTVPVGGPYGVIALLEGLTLLSALKLVGAVAPYSDIWPEYGRYQAYIVWGLIALSILALIGLPGAELIVSTLTVVGVGIITVYLVRRGAAGSRAARVLAPSAAVFALVTCAATLASFGVFHSNPLAPKIIGGFAAAGAVLVALALSAGEGLGLMGAPVLRTRATAPSADLPVNAAQPLTSSALPAAVAAIAASHQGVYELNFATDTLHLSAEGAVLLGWPGQPKALAHASFIGRIHADDRAIYKQAMSDYRANPGLAFRIEYRLKNEAGRYLWCELRATMMGEGDLADTCLGLMADVTTRKEAEVAAIDRSLHDTLTGLGNRAALMEAVERLGRAPAKALLAIMDIDRFEAIRLSLGYAGADAVLRHVAERLSKRYRSQAQIFRVGGNAFALLFASSSEEANSIGVELLELSSTALTENGRRIFAPASIGLARAADCAEAIDMVSNAELALRVAKRAGGGCMRLYTCALDGAASPPEPAALAGEPGSAADDGAT